MKHDFVTATQLFLSSEQLEHFSNNRIKEKIKLASDCLALDSIMIWSCDDLSPLEPIIDYCQKLSIKVYAWFPLLSDLSYIKVLPGEYVTDFREGNQGTATGAWELSAELEQGFSFACPNNTQLTGKVFDFLTSVAGSYHFDGFFFDKIRYPSPANGFESLFTCFCPSCYEAFEKEYGYSLDIVKKRVASLLENIKGLTDAGLEKIKHFSHLLNQAGLEDFFRFRERSIYSLTKKCCDFVRSRGKIAALDLFSPSIAGFVSQDYTLLAPLANWLKPMIYCHVIGPAGIPLEIVSFCKALRTLNPGLSEEAVLAFAGRILGTGLESNLELILQKGINSRYAGFETRKINKLLEKTAVKVYPGIEAILNPAYGASIDEHILGVYLEEVQSYADGFVASWNLLDMSDKNIKFMGRKIGTL